MKNAALLLQIAELNKAIEVECNTLFVDFAMVDHLRSLRDQLEAQITDPRPSDVQVAFRLWRKSYEVLPFTAPRVRPVSCAIV